MESVDTADVRYLTSWRLYLVIMFLTIGSFLVGLDTLILVVAIPKLTSDFDSLGDIAWYGSAYLLVVTALQPMFGTLYRLFGAKTIYLASVVVFEVGSILCALASNSPMFIGGRAVAGVGAAGIYQGAISIISIAVELAKRPLYVSIVVGIFGISVCVSPILGGVFTDDVSWRWCFWVNVPIGAVVFVLILCILRIDRKPDTRAALPLRQKLKHIDFIGAAVFIGCVSCIVLALQLGGQTDPWDSARVIGLLVGFTLLLPLFVYLQWRRGERAMIPLRILRQRSMCMGSCFLFLYGMARTIFGYYVPFFFQTVQDTSATTSGVNFIASVIPQMFFTIIAGVVVSKWGYYVPYMILGTCIATVGSGLLTTFDPHIQAVRWASYLAISGLGAGIAMQLPYTAIQLVLSEKDVPIGNAISILSWQLGSALGLPICQNLFLHSLKTRAPAEVPQIPVETILGAGAGNLESLTDDPAVLDRVRLLYSQSIHPAFVVTLVAFALALPCACAMEWLNVRTVDSDKKEEDQRDGSTELHQVCLDSRDSKV